MSPVSCKRRSINLHQESAYYQHGTRRALRKEQSYQKIILSNIETQIISNPLYSMILVLIYIQLFIFYLFDDGTYNSVQWGNNMDSVKSIRCVSSTLVSILKVFPLQLQPKICFFKNKLQDFPLLSMIVQLENILCRMCVR